MRQEKRLHGVIPAIVTPITKTGKLDIKLLEKQTEYLVNAGVHGLFLCGGTGEGAYLKTEEKTEIFRTVKSIAGDKIFLCLALIQSNTRAVTEEMEKMQDLKPDYIVATAPYYHAASQEDIYEHYRIIAALAPTPVIIYNIPSATHNPIELDTVYRLQELDNIAGIKDSSGNFMQFSRGLFAPGKKEFAWIQGEDYLCAPTLLAGGDGMVSGLSNAKVEPYVEMYRACECEDWETVKKCQAKINQLYKIIGSCGNGNAAIKAVTEIEGRGSRWMQERSMSLSDVQVKEISKILEDYEKIGE
ncbi:MAG: dihydrodipicolinate synthase family protein [Eubacteriales bacterium]|nr:dihydrodipicolinate synthase family protein [Eubacteriales bacterium]